MPDSYNCQNPFYVHGMLNDKKESKYALPIRKNGELKSFLFLRKIMILWLGVYFTYLGMQYLNPDINSTVVEILLNISLAFMIMARVCMWIFYVKFYKRIINIQQIKKEIGRHSVLCARISICIMKIRCVTGIYRYILM